MKIKTYFIYYLSLFLLVSVSCEKQELTGDPVAETYTLTLNGQSLTGELEVLLDGEVKWTGRKVETLLPMTLLYSKGERKLEVREKGKTEILKTYTLDVKEKKNHTIKFYWNGEEITEQLEMPSPEEGYIGFLLKIDMEETGYTEPMDIEIRYYYPDETWTNHITEPLDTINNYIPGSGYTRYIEVRAMNPPAEDWTGQEDLFLRLYKAGTKEPYHTLMSQWTFNYEQPDECYIQAQVYYSFEEYKTNTALIRVYEYPGSFSLNNDYIEWGKTGNVSYFADFIPGDQAEEESGEDE